MLQPLQIWTVVCDMLLKQREGKEVMLQRRNKNTTSAPRSRSHNLGAVHPSCDLMGMACHLCHLLKVHYPNLNMWEEYQTNSNLGTSCKNPAWGFSKGYQTHQGQGQSEEAERSLRTESLNAMLYPWMKLGRRTFGKHWWNPNKMLTSANKRRTKNGTKKKKEEFWRHKRKKRRRGKW